MSISISQNSNEPPLDALIPCRVYLIFGPHPVLGYRTLLYVGECVDTPRRGPRDRFAEHLEDQPWGDTVPHRTYEAALAAGTLVVSTEVYATKRKARVAERDAIIAGQPLYNWKCNELNPIQIPRWDQETQRAERDQHRGIPKHKTWAVVHGGQNVTGWRKVIVKWSRLRRRQRRQIVSTAFGVAVTTALTLFVFFASSLSLVTSITLGVGMPILFVLWLNRPSRRRKVRHAVNEAARYALIGAIVVQLFYDLFR